MSYAGAMTSAGVHENRAGFVVARLGRDNFYSDKTSVSINSFPLSARVNSYMVEYLETVTLSLLFS